jgi:hypothetical protein
MSRVILSIPLTLIPILLYLMPTGPAGYFSQSEFIIAVAVICSVIEAWKATSTGALGMIDFMLSLIVAVLSLLAWVMLPAFATTTFALLVLFAFADVAAGAIITMRASRRDIGIG